MEEVVYVKAEDKEVFQGETLYYKEVNGDVYKEYKVKSRGGVFPDVVNILDNKGAGRYVFAEDLCKKTLKTKINIEITF